MDAEALLTHDEFLKALAKSLVFGSEDFEDAVQDTYLGGSEGTVALIGSTAFLEIGLPRKGASQSLGAKRGAPVVVEF